MKKIIFIFTGIIILSFSINSFSQKKVQTPMVPEVEITDESSKDDKSVDELFDLDIDIDLDTDSDNDYMIVGEDVELSEEGYEDAVVVGGNLSVKTNISGDAVCVGGDLTIAEQIIIGGDSVCVGGDIYLYKDSVVNGDTVCIGGKIHNQGAEIKGETVHIHLGGMFKKLFQGIVKHAGKEKVIKREFFSSYEFGWTYILITFIIQLILGIIISFAFPKTLESISGYLVKKPITSGLIGMGYYCLLFPVVIILIITILGIIIIPIAVISYLTIITFGLTVLSQFIGKKLLEIIKVKSEQNIVHLLIGIILLNLVRIIQSPGIGSILFMFIVMFGTGATFARLVAKKKTNTV